MSFQTITATQTADLAIVVLPLSFYPSSAPPTGIQIADHPFVGLHEGMVVLLPPGPYSSFLQISTSSLPFYFAA